MITTRPSTPVPESTMVQLLRRNATVIQVGFALLWSLRFVMAVRAPEVPVVVAITGAFAIRSAFRWTRGPRARDVFRTPEGRRFLRPVTWLTVAQVVGSIVLPGILGAFGAERWVLPSVAVTIGLFLVGFSSSLRVRAVRHIGAAATVLALGLPLLASGEVLTASTAASMIAALLASTWCCSVAARTDAARRTDFTQRSHLGNGAEIAIGQHVGAPSHFSKDHRGLPS